jgi:hypothetical protein
MLTTPLAGEDRLTTAHRAKLAYVYVRPCCIEAGGCDTEAGGLKGRPLSLQVC